MRGGGGTSPFQPNEALYVTTHCFRNTPSKPLFLSTALVEKFIDCFQIWHCANDGELFGDKLWVANWEDFIFLFFVAHFSSPPAVTHKWSFSTLMLHNLIVIVMELPPLRLCGAGSQNCGAAAACLDWEDFLSPWLLIQSPEHRNVNDDSLILLRPAGRGRRRKSVLLWLSLHIN